MARRVDRRGAHRVLVGNLKERDLFEDIGVDGRIILKWVFKKWGREAWTDVQLAGACEYSNEPWGSMKCREFLD